MTTSLKVSPKLDNAAIARRLRMHMGDLKISRAALAEASGISRPALGTKLDNQVGFTIDDINAIAAALGTTWLWVADGVGDPPDPSKGQLTRRTARKNVSYMKRRKRSSKPGGLREVA